MGDGGGSSHLPLHEVISSCVYLRKLLQGLKKIRGDYLMLSVSI